MYELSYTFNFEAAHDLAQSSPAQAQEPGVHAYSRVHGHSFVATVILSAESLTKDGWVTDIAAVRAACDKTRDALDHRLLNEIEGLETPTLEVIAQWIFDALSKDLPALARIEVARPTLGERATYRP
ncbi:MAG: 6-carboxytetrahydropterin synthase [Pseudomonadota bacterium]